MENEYLTNDEWVGLTDQLCEMITERTDKSGEWLNSETFSELQTARDDLVDLIHNIRGLLVDTKEAQ
jgi:hypothetical protein|tara:strand:+ start:189 stop:389 length:201 start_codon:yes stop_codon:yes gene_type:complete